MDYMSTNDFETLAKNMVIETVKNNYGIEVSMDDLEFVWFAHELGYKKCTLYAKELGDYYPEVTYNKEKNEMYVNVYLKQSNTKIDGKDFKKYLNK